MSDKEMPYLTWWNFREIRGQLVPLRLESNGKTHWLGRAAILALQHYRQGVKLSERIAGQQSGDASQIPDFVFCVLFPACRYNSYGVPPFLSIRKEESLWRLTDEQGVEYEETRGQRFLLRRATDADPETQHKFGYSAMRVAIPKEPMSEEDLAALYARSNQS